MKMFLKIIGGIIVGYLTVNGIVLNCAYLGNLCRYIVEKAEADGMELTGDNIKYLIGIEFDKISDDFEHFKQVYFVNKGQL